MSALSELLANIRVLPVLTVRSPESAVALVDALVGGGVRGVEITLRTPQAVAAIGAVRRAFPDLPVAAGTVRSTDDLDIAAAAGVSFVVSPGFTDALAAGAARRGVPLLVGVATASEVMRGHELGLDCFKLFPVNALNGLLFLRAIADPFPDVGFVPTGGLDAASAREYLAVANVRCVAGSWLAPSRLVEVGAWGEITQLARDFVSSSSQRAAQKTAQQSDR